MRPTGFGQRIADGALFKTLKERAAEYLRDPQKLAWLASEANKKAASIGRHGPLKDVWNSLMAFFRLIRAVVRGEYTEVPWHRLVLIVAGVLYFRL